MYILSFKSFLSVIPITHWDLHFNRLFVMYTPLGSLFNPTTPQNAQMFLSGYHADTPITIKAEAIP